MLLHLKEVGFQVRLGGAEPFGEHLPLVTGVAWETETAQLVLVAEGEGELEPAQWRQLLFAGSGIRHQLAADEASAFGTPVVVAIVDQEAGGELRRLAESLAKDYAVFSRVDLNLVPQGDVGNKERLDDALAPLLPRCRRIRGSEISKREVQQFWDLLRKEVEKAADELDDVFGERRRGAGRDGAETLIGDSAMAPELPPPMPIEQIEISRFRSIESLDLKLANVNVIHGPNGSGKTSLVEAMELAWAGTSQRKPPNVTEDEYAAHLPLDGTGEFAIDADGHSTKWPAKPRAELRRCVLTQEAMAAMASETPKERFTTLLGVTGLEIPDVKARTETLLRECKQEVDQALSAAGMANLPRMDRVGLKHMHEELESDFASRYAALSDLATLEEALTSVSKGAFKARGWMSESATKNLLARADQAVEASSKNPSLDSHVGPALDEACEVLGQLLDERSQAAAATRRLLERLRAQLRAEKAIDETTGTEEKALSEQSRPIGVELASRWLRHAEGLDQAAKKFRADAEGVEDDAWAKQLLGYATGVEQAAKLAPVTKLESLSSPVAPSTPSLEVKADPEAQQAAGFNEKAIDAPTVGPVLRELSDALDAHVTALRDIGQRLERHPARNLHKHWEGLMNSLCRFELARTLRREGPIQQASEQLVCKLLDERLAPVVRELMAAIVRFDWYFKPLKMSSQKRQVVLGGLSTGREDLDVRLLLNSAEKAVLGLAWFLALHMLQPRERRLVLVLDDPTSAFDTANIAGFTSTLRALTRLLKPEQMVIASHDDQVAAVLSEELAAVDGWPASVRRIRFQRNAKEHSEPIEEWASEHERKTAPELEQLGLLDEAPSGPGAIAQR